MNPQTRPAADLPQLTELENFYELLLELGAADELAPIIDSALKLLLELTAATSADLRLWGAPPALHCQHAWGSAPPQVPGALIDRMVELQRTVELRLAANVVLCTPVCVDVPVGVVSLTRNGEAFTALDRKRIESFARHVALRADRMVAAPRSRSLTDDMRTLQAQRVRLAMSKNGNNVSAVARELKVTRTQIYRVLKRIDARSARH